MRYSEYHTPINHNNMESDFLKVYLVKDVDLDMEYIISDVLTEVFLIVDQRNYKTVQFMPSYPVVNLNNELTDKLCNLGLLKSSNVINTSTYKKFTSNKVTTYKYLENLGILPKTVYSKEDVYTLKFPIVCKISNGAEGRGLEFFEKLSNFNLSPNLYDLYSEKIDIDKEYRFIFYKDELIKIKQKVNKEGLEDKERKEKIDFKHIALEKDLSDESLKKCYDLSKIVKQKFDFLELMGLDIALDKKGKVWLIEVNSEPGLTHDIGCNLYKAVYEDFYKKEMKEESLEKLKLLKEKSLKLYKLNEK